MKDFSDICDPDIYVQSHSRTPSHSIDLYAWYPTGKLEESNAVGGPEMRLYRAVIIRAILDYAKFKISQKKGERLTKWDVVEFHDLEHFFFVDDPEFLTFFTLSEYLFNDSDAIREHIRKWLRTDYFWKDLKYQGRPLACPELNKVS